MLHNRCPVSCGEGGGEGAPAGLEVIRPADKDKGTDRCKVAVITEDTVRLSTRDDEAGRCSLYLIKTVPPRRP